MIRFIIIPLVLLINEPDTISQSPARARDLGIEIGVYKTGRFNAITDVDGVRVGHVTLISGGEIRTGVTAILPHPGIYSSKKCLRPYISGTDSEN